MEKVYQRNQSSKIIRRMIPGLILGFVAMIGLAIFGDIKNIGKIMNDFNWIMIPVVLSFTLMNYFLRYVKWHYYLNQIGAHNISKLESLRIFIAGFPLAVTPGKVGEALKGVWIKQKTGIPVGRGISVVLAERISDGLAVLALSTLGVLAYPQYWLVFCLVLVLLLCIVIITQIRPLALALLKIGYQIPLLKRMIGGLHDLYEGSFALFRPGVTLISVGLGIISWLGEGIGFFFVLAGLGIPYTIHTLGIAVFILSFSTVLGAVSALPGGLIAAEASIAGMLTLLLSVDPAISTSATVIIRLATLWFGVGLGLITWLFSKDLLLGGEI